jgi:hypothetical protein
MNQYAILKDISITYCQPLTKTNTCTIVVWMLVSIQVID